MKYKSTVVKKLKFKIPNRLSWICIFIRAQKLYKINRGIKYIILKYWYGHKDFERSFK